MFIQLKISIMKYVFVMISFAVTLSAMSCSNNKSGNNNTQSATDSSSTLDMSRKSGNNTGVRDSSMNIPDSVTIKTDTARADKY